MGLYSFASLIPSSNITLYFGNSSSAQYFKNGMEEMAGRTFRTYELEKNAGVKVRMITSDNVQTARAIALECGILTSDADASEPNLGMGVCIRLCSNTLGVMIVRGDLAVERGWERLDNIQEIIAVCKVASVQVILATQVI
ncbi:hypothetical protein F2Q70_00035106 [Brassica cretica]|uniref:Uncharacterized protein n=1 Tax=Brassica cretica TaxID=69181 RepID=A0A8S9JS86_BRACR|nr:hypothetical protein F2Q70_00035106 [Brassica cretica]